MNNENPITKPNLREMLKQIQADIQASIAKERIRLLTFYEDLEEVSGQDAVEDSVLAIVNHFGATGIGSRQLASVFPDAAEMKAARDRLVQKGAIKSKKEGTTLILTPAATVQE